MPLQDCLEIGETMVAATSEEAIGNALSLNVAERVLTRLLPASTLAANQPYDFGSWILPFLPETDVRSSSYHASSSHVYSLRPI